MDHHDVSRRTLLKGGGAIVAGATVAQVGGPASAFAGEAADVEDIVVDEGALAARSPIPPGEPLDWFDQPPDIPDNRVEITGSLLRWEELDSFFTPAEEFFWVKHYDLPDLSDLSEYRLAIDGLVDRPQSFTLEDLKRRTRRAVDFTLECSGNQDTSEAFFIGGIGTARWAGTPLAPLLRRARPRDTATEVVFWGDDRGTVTIRDNTGITGGGRTGTIIDNGPSEPPDLRITEQFARSMKLEDAMNSDNLLCFEMNGEPLPQLHGYPVRLIAPGWYGVANVKWLTRIEVIDHRFAGQFMARDYVSIREDESDHWTFQTVSHFRLKSAPAKVVRNAGQYTIFGVAWGAPIAAVEVKIDDGSWRRAELVGPRHKARRKPGFAWRFWTLPWPSPSRGVHRITSQAIDTDGNVQPAPDDLFLASRRTFWEANGHITRQVEIT
jgi:DMSO/TMAO reductase YedYZ molybdopterin-dependent catalytic subunit